MELSKLLKNYIYNDLLIEIIEDYFNINTVKQIDEYTYEITINENVFYEKSILRKINYFDYLNACHIKYDKENLCNKITLKLNTPIPFNDNKYHYLFIFMLICYKINEEGSIGDYDDGLYKDDIYYLCKNNSYLIEYNTTNPIISLIEDDICAEEYIDKIYEEKKLCNKFIMEQKLINI